METLFIGRQRFELEELNSTNQYAQELLRNQMVKEGASIVVRNQTKGKGQRGASWEAEPGKNLTISIILLPVFLPASDQFFLSRISALAITDLLKALPGINPDEIKIKWPNDIYAGNRKVAGILIENSWRGNDLAASVIGIGLNVNQDKFESAPLACSLKNITGTEYVLRSIEDALYECLERRYLQLRTDKKQQIMDEYHSLLYRLGQWHVFYKGAEPFTACIEGVTDMGLLRLKMENGTEQNMDLKEIRYSHEEQ